jgi:hypothetical protein
MADVACLVDGRHSLDRPWHTSEAEREQLEPFGNKLPAAPAIVYLPKCSVTALARTLRSYNNVSGRETDFPGLIMAGLLPGMH